MRAGWVHSLDAFVRARPSRSRLVAVASILGVLVLGLGDWFTGPEVVFSAFYMVPILVAAWFGGWRPGMLAAATSVGCWTAVRGLAREDLAAWLVVHATVSRFLVYAVVVLSVSALRQALVAAERRQQDLVRALEEIQTLRGLLPICSKCKKIRDDEGSWHPVEAYVSRRSQATFTHGYCPDCLQKLYEEMGHRPR